MATGPFTLRESGLGTRLGVSRDLVRSHRRAEDKGLLWSLGPNRAVFWSEDGFTWLAAQIAKTPPPSLALPDHPSEAENGAPTSDPPPPPDASLSLPAAKKTAVLTCLRCNFRNTRVLQARTPDGQVVTVVGVKAEMFHPGFLLLALPTAMGDVWEFEGDPSRPDIGRRMPRGKRDPVWPRENVLA